MKSVTLEITDVQRDIYCVCFLQSNMLSETNRRLKIYKFPIRLTEDRFFNFLSLSVRIKRKGYSILNCRLQATQSSFQAANTRLSVYLPFVLSHRKAKIKFSNKNRTRTNHVLFQKPYRISG